MKPHDQKILPLLLLAIVLLASCTQYDSPPELVCSVPQSGQPIAPDDKLRLKFTEPIDPATLHIMVAPVTEPGVERAIDEIDKVDTARLTSIDYELEYTSDKRYATLNDFCEKNVKYEIKPGEEVTSNALVIDPINQLEIVPYYLLVIKKGLADLDGNRTGIDYALPFSVVSEGQGSEVGSEVGSEESAASGETAESSGPQEDLRWEDGVFLVFIPLDQPLKVEIEFYWDFKFDQKAMTFRAKGTDADGKSKQYTEDSCKYEPTNCIADNTITYDFHGSINYRSGIPEMSSENFNLTLSNPELTITNAALSGILTYNDKGQKIITGTMTSEEVILGDPDKGVVTKGAKATLSGKFLTPDEIPDNLNRIE